MTKNLQDLKPTDVDYFAEHGYIVRGVIHIGANDGDEVFSYIDKGFVPIIAVEPNPIAFDRLLERFEGDAQVLCINLAFGNEETEVEMFIPENGDDEKTSAFHPIPTNGHDWTFDRTGETIKVLCNRFDAWRDRLRFDLSPYNTLVIDAQGMELHVLEGCGRHLSSFDFISVELSREPVYYGEPSAEKVIEFLDRAGFHQISEVKEHDDVYFMRVGGA